MSPVAPGQHRPPECLAALGGDDLNLWATHRAQAEHRLYRAIRELQDNKAALLIMDDLVSALGSLRLAASYERDLPDAEGYL